MTVANDLERVAKLCRTGARRILEAQFSLGSKPEDPAQALQWDKVYTQLQDQLNSLSALNSKLTADVIISELQNLSEEIQKIGKISVEAEIKIKKINEVSKLLIEVAKVLDLGLAILAAGATPSPATISALIGAGVAVASISA